MYPMLIKENDGYFFKNENEEKSEKYFYAEEYVDGYALVQKEENGKWQYRNKEGKLSEKYFQASPYSLGVAVVRKTANSPFNFLDIYGNESEDFYSATLYKDGYSLVQKERNGANLYRDVFGKLSKETTEIGDYSYKYMKKEIKKSDIPRSLFFNESFRLNILSEEIRRDKELAK